MQDLNQLVYFNLPIPVWQVVSYVGLMSVFMFQRRFRLSFVASFALVLFWLHYAYRADLTNVVTADYVARAIYHILGFALIIAGIYASCFLQDDADALLDKREREIADLKSRAKDAENRASSLESQLGKEQKKESSTKNKLEKKLTSKIEKLERQLQASESMGEQRDTEIAELKAKTVQAQQNASALEDQIGEYRQSILANESARQQLEETFNANILKLEQQLKESENLLEKRAAEIAELGAKASDADRKALDLEAQLQQDQANESASKKQLKNELNAKIENLEQQVKHGQTLLEQRAAEIAETAKNATALRAQLEKQQNQSPASNKKANKELSAKIDRLALELQESRSVLEQRDAEIAELKAKTDQAQQKAAALEDQIRDYRQSTHANESNRQQLEERFNADVLKLERQLKESESLLDERAAAIAELEAKAREAETSANALKDQLESDRGQKSAATKALEEELNKNILKLEQQLKESENLLEKRAAEIAELGAKASDADRKALDLEAQLQQDQANESASKKQLENELNAKIETLQQQVKESQGILETRAAEVAALEAKAREAETSAAALKDQLDSDRGQKSAATKALEEELNKKILKLEQQLKESENLLEKRAAEIAELRVKPAEIVNRASAPKVQTAKGSPAVKTKAANGDSEIEEDVRRKLHQFQYAVKYLEDQIKEKDHLLSLMAKKNTQTQAANSKNKIDEDLRKKIQQLEQDVKLLGQQSKEKDGLLSLMAKRNRELAELKAKAEEKLQNLEKGGGEGQVEKGAA